MTKYKRKGNGGKSNGNGDYGEPPETGEDQGADPVRIHQDYVQRHVGGGAPATTEAYERAVEQFNKLPGAIRTPPTRVIPARPTPEPDNDGSTKSDGYKSDEPPS